MKQKVLLGVALSSLLLLAGCVSKQTYVGSDKPVSDRTFDNIEAARTRISLGLNYMRRGDMSQAKYNLERARSFAPNSAEVHSALAYYYQSVGEHKQAEEYFRLAIQKDANYADAYNNYGAFLCQLERYEESEQLLLKAISRPGYIRVAESYENLALCKLQQNNFTQAKTYLDNSTSHNATRITSLTMSAGLSYAMGDTRESKALLDRIQRLGRVSSRTVLLSYLIAQKNGDQDTMRNAEQLLITLYTDTPETRLLLQKKLDDSEFEQLRERYKDSLMANIVLPDDAAAKPEVPGQPVANPKLKIVKRKAGNDTDDTAPADKPARERRSRTAKAGAADPVATPALNNATSAIAGSLTTDNAAVVIPANAVAQLPTETELTQAAKQLTAAEVEEPAVQAVTAAVADNLKQTEQQPNEQQQAQPELKPAEQTQADPLQKAQTIMPEVMPEPVELTQHQPETALAVQPDAETTGVVATVDSTVATAFHVVQAAESLYAISVKHNIRLPSLMQWNQLTPDSVIKTGQKIWLGPVTDAERVAQVQTKPALEREQVNPLQPYHIVAEGETMFGISYRYNVRLSSFMDWNSLTDASKLKVGQQLYVVDPASIAQ